MSLQAGEALRRLRVSDGVEVVLLDLVAEPVPPVERPAAHELEGCSVLVDTPHEILVNKLCSLVSRSELRDLSDISDLLAAGGDLQRALVDAPRKEAGCSPLTLASSLRRLPVASMAEVAGIEEESRDRLSTTRDDLVGRVTAASRPGR